MRAKAVLLTMGLIAGLPPLLGQLAATAQPGGEMAAHLAGLAAVLLAAQCRIRPLRRALALLLAVSSWFALGYWMAMGHAMTRDVFVTMFGYRGFTGLAWEQYGGPIVLSGLASAPLLFGLAMAPRRGLPGWQALCALGLGLVPQGVLLAQGLERVAAAAPGALQPLSYALDLGARRITAVTVPPGRVEIPAPSAPPRGDVVLVIDESVGGAWLDLNAPGGVRSGLLTPGPDWQVANFGLASAITNCTFGSNITLRHGGRRGDYRQRNQAGPTIWAYARAAGFETVYIDAQTTGGTLHNGMTPAERALIDRHVQFDGVPVTERDHRAAAMLAALLADGRSQFVLINKQGGHFPVHDKYPPAAMRYRPALPRQSRFTWLDFAPDQLWRAADKDWPRYRNSYRNTLEWNTGGFFDQVLHATGKAPVTLLYTADHGQDLHQRGNRGMNTHCTPDALPEEAVVPMVVLSRRVAGSDWPARARAARDLTSAWELFPTLLHLLGYDPQQVTARFGPALGEAPRHDPQTWNARFNTPDGLEPEWIGLNPRRTLMPPRREESLP